MDIAKMRVKQIATEAINRAITEEIVSDADVDHLIDWRTGPDNKITGFTLNYGQHMKITSAAVELVQSKLDELEQMPEKIPVGQALNSAILASFGPDVPIRLIPAGAVKIDLSTRQSDAGINMLLVEVYMRVTVEVSVIIPFASDYEVLQTDIPVTYLLVVGDVPMYYFDNKGNPIGGSDASGVVPPTISLPDIQSQIPTP